MHEIQLARLIDWVKQTTDLISLTKSNNVGDWIVVKYKPKKNEDQHICKIC